jgi:hypothetical protein
VSDPSVRKRLRCGDPVCVRVVQQYQGRDAI